ncbi:MAG TPA: hypothetical protein VGJ28_26350 [Micromonosporaceae bacterium]
MRTRIAVVSTIFYVGVVALLAGVLFKIWPDVLPKGLATRIGHNSEGYATILAVAPWIQFIRPRIAGKRYEWLITGIGFLALAGLTAAMLAGDWASRFKTLNEGTAAAAVLIPYVQLRRPFPRWVAWTVFLVVTVATIVTSKTVATTDMAESWVMVVFAIAGFDLIDTGILNRDAVTSAVARWSYYAFLVVVPILCSLAEYHWGAGSSRLYGETVRFMVRVDESFIFAIFTLFFFAVGLGRTGRREVASSPVVEPSPVESVPV